LGGVAGLTDGELLAQFAATQEQAAFEELLRRHGPMVLRVCQRVLHHTQDAEDAFQATFIVLVRTAKSIAKQESVASWLYGVAYRIAQDAKRSAAQRHTREQLSPATVLANHQPAQDRGASTGQELGPLLDEEINGLSEKLRAVVVLCYFEGKTNEEAGKLLRC